MADITDCRQTYKIGQPFRLSSVESLNFSRKGYDFAHWTDDDGNILSDGQENVVISKNRYDISAVWNPITYQITYVMDGGTNVQTNPSTFTIEKEVTSSDLADPTRENSIFYGWYAGKNKFRSTANVNDDLVLNAKWVLENYKISAGVDSEYGNIIVTCEDTCKNNTETFTMSDKDTKDIHYDSRLSIRCESNNDDYESKSLYINEKSCTTVDTHKFTNSLTDADEYINVLNISAGFVSKYGTYPVKFYATNGKVANVEISAIVLPMKFMISDSAVNSPFNGFTDIEKREYLSEVWDKYAVVSSIGDSAFKNCENLEYVDLRAITNVPKEAFNTCGKLKFVNTGEISSIGDYAFQNCGALTSMHLENVRDIGQKGFDGSGLSGSITLPNLTSCADYAFHNCKSLTEISAPNISSAAAGVFYQCDKLSGAHLDNVVEINDNAFRECCNLNAIPNQLNLLSIGLNALSACHKINDAMCPKVENLLASVFRDCTCLTAINFENVKTIENYAFKNCQSLVQVNLPKVTKLGDSAFSNCLALQHVDLPELSDLGSNVFGDFNTREKPLSCLSSVNVPKLVLLRSYAFKNSGLLSIDVHLVENISNQSFYGCSSLNRIVTTNATTIESQAFYNCKKLSAFNAPRLSSIGLQAFTGCPLTSFETGDAVEIIRNDAFGVSSSFSKLNLPNARSIGNNILDNIKSLDTVVLSSVRYCPKLGTTLSSEIDNMISVYVPDDLSSNFKTYGTWGTLYDAGKLVFIGVQKNRRGVKFTTDDGRECIYEKELFNDGFYYKIKSDLTATAEFPFNQDPYSSYKISSVIDECGCIEKINKNTFSNSTYGPKTISFRNALSVEDGAFSHYARGGDRLEYADMEKAEYFGSSAFESNTKLKTINIPNAVSFGSNCFKDCSELSSMYTPNLLSIGYYCFLGNKNLKWIYCPNLEYMHEGRGYQSVLGIAFQNYRSLSSFQAPKLKYYIPVNTFDGCSSLISADVGQVSSMHTGAFKNCNSLTCVRCEDVQNLSGSVFQNCTSLSTISMPKLHTIGSTVFDNCSAMTDLIIPNLSGQINADVFNGCINLSCIDLSETEKVPVLQYSNKKTALDSLPENFIVKVKESMLSVFKNANNWSNYAGHLTS